MFCHGRTNIVLNHELGELVAVRRDDFLFDLLDVVPRLWGESGRGYHHAFSHPMAFKAARKGLYDRATDGGIPFLGLDVDGV